MFSATEVGFLIDLSNYETKLFLLTTETTY